jgi:hypothetical protein
MIKIKNILVIIFMLAGNLDIAGPPYFTDDPEPVDYHHWELYLSSMNTFDIRNKLAIGTLPHIEVNYGVVPNVQLHLVLPSGYQYSYRYEFDEGYTYTEFGVKYRFLKEKKNIPQIGVFPIIEIPTFKDSRFGDENIQVYLPVWVQKSWKKLTTYGGGGYWINPGAGNRNWIFTGWEIQYDFTDFLNLGTELYFHTASSAKESAIAGLTIGGSLNFSDHIHFIFSAGHSFFNEDLLTTYAGLYMTF